MDLPLYPTSNKLEIKRGNRYSGAPSIIGGDPEEEITPSLLVLVRTRTACTGCGRSVLVPSLRFTSPASRPIPQGGIGREDRLFLLHGDVQRYAMHIGEEGEYCVRIVQGEHVLCPRDTYAGAQ